MSENIPLQSWTQENEEWKETFLDRDHRILLWSNNEESREDIPLLQHLLSREGPLIAKNLTLRFDEENESEWYRGDVSLVDFLNKYGDWFSELQIETMREDDYDNFKAPYLLSTDKINQIRKASRIPSVAIRSPNIALFVPLLRGPHVRRVTLIQAEIFRSTIELLRDHHYETLTLYNCIFKWESLQILRDHPLPSLRIVDHEYKKSENFIDMLPEYPCLHELSFDHLSFVSRDRVFETLTSFTSLQKLSIPYYRIQDNEIDYISKLTNLSNLNMARGHHPGDQVIPKLSRLSKLQRLNIEFAIIMTPAYCDQIVHKFPLLEKLVWYYDGKYEGDDPARDVSTMELLEMIQLLAQMRGLRELNLMLTSEMNTGIVRRFLSRQLVGLTSPTLKSVNVRSTRYLLKRNLLQDRNQSLFYSGNQYLYIVFILIRAWYQRVGLIVVFPKDIVNLILTEYAPFLGKDPLVIKKMVEFVWNNWQQMERLIHEKRSFKVVQSSDEVKLVGVSHDERWEIIASV